MEIITSRPEGMDFDLYKSKLKFQKQILKQRLQGVLVWNPFAEVLGRTSEGQLLKPKTVMLKKGIPYERKFGDLLPLRPVTREKNLSTSKFHTNRFLKGRFFNNN